MNLDKHTDSTGLGSNVFMTQKISFHRMSKAESINFLFYKQKCIYLFMLISMSQLGSDFTLGEGIDMLRGQGVIIEALGADRLLIGGRLAKVFLRHTVPSPAQITSLKTAVSLYVIPKITPGLRVLASRDSRLGLIALRTGEIWLHGACLTTGTQSANTDLKRPAIKLPWVRFGLLRSLALRSTPRSQAQLAQELGVSQPAVSAALSSLREIVHKTKGGWVANSFRSVTDEFLLNYPGPGGMRRHWFSLDPIMTQGARIAQNRPRALISGDLAADQLAPWKTPRTGVVYSPSELGLGELGFAESDPVAGTLIEVIPGDPTVWTLSKALGHTRLADALLIAYDLDNSKGADSREAVSTLLAELEKRRDSHGS
jgi:hypothetical protein